MVRYPFTLQQLFQLAGFHPTTFADVPVDHRELLVGDLTCDSRQVSPGAVFVAIPGSQVDGHEFLLEAATGGAICAIVQSRNPNIPLPQIETNCPASVYGKLCMKLLVGNVNPVQTAGVTGTNGKTTTTWMLQSILQAAGKQAGVIGTICHHDGIHQIPSKNTTPDAKTLAELFESMARNHTSHCAMEISSHALAQNRAAGVQLSAAAITNITQDHFDYHGHIDSYRKAKASVHELLHPEAPLLLNLDDPVSRTIQDEFSGMLPLITCGTQSRGAEIFAEVVSQNHRSTQVRLHLAQGDCNVRIKMVGTHNVSNCLMAAGLAEQMGMNQDAIVRGLQGLQSVPGRLQRIDMGQPFQVFVDYAHTPDALQHCLQTVKSITTNRVICVFGAGGDRDRSKRPVMGNVASAADRCIVTTDSPRTESPEAIIADVVAGIPATTDCLSVVQRKDAITIAIQEASVGDTVIITGRGHETMQEVGEHLVPLQDAACVQTALQTLGYTYVPSTQYSRSA